MTKPAAMYLSTTRERFIRLSSSNSALPLMASRRRGRKSVTVENVITLASAHTPRAKRKICCVHRC